METRGERDSEVVKNRSSWGTWGVCSSLQGTTPPLSFPIFLHHHTHPCSLHGKRQYHEEESGGQGEGMKKEKVVLAYSSSQVVPRCQVEGCNIGLVDAKDYHRRHKVCEAHSKAPNAVVLGLDQRFCQQCSRFHVVSEFDGAKRSCRRRLAGHNERRRKISNASAMRNTLLDNTMMGSRFSYVQPPDPSDRALSLLSARADISLRSSAELRMFIAENCTTLALHRHQTWGHCAQVNVLNEWENLHKGNSHVTLDLMQRQHEEDLPDQILKSSEEAHN